MVVVRVLFLLQLVYALFKSVIAVPCERSCLDYQEYTYAMYSSHHSETALNLSEELKASELKLDQSTTNSSRLPELHDEGCWYKI